MKKVSFAAALSIAAMSSSVIASEWFVGLETGKAENNLSAIHDNAGIENGVATSVSKSNAKSNSFGLRVGKYINENIRVYGTLSRNKFRDPGVDSFNFKINSELDVSGIQYQDSLMFSSDYVFLEDSPIRPFIGASLGLTTIKAFGKTAGGIAYGAQLGVMSQAGPIDLEVGLKYTGNNIEVKKDANVDGGNFLSLKNQNIRMAYLSASYRF